MANARSTLSSPCRLDLGHSSSIMSDLFPCQDDALHMAMDCCILRLPTQPMHLKRNYSTPTPQVQTTLDNQRLLGPLSLFWFMFAYFCICLHLLQFCIYATCSFHEFIRVSWVLFVRPSTEVVPACPSPSPKGEQHRVEKLTQREDGSKSNSKVL